MTKENRKTYKEIMENNCNNCMLFKSLEKETNIAIGFCNNSNSDHFLHVLYENHPICEKFFKKKYKKE